MSNCNLFTSWNRRRGRDNGPQFLPYGLVFDSRSPVEQESSKSKDREARFARRTREDMADLIAAVRARRSVLSHDVTQRFASIHCSQIGAANVFFLGSRRSLLTDAKVASHEVPGGCRRRSGSRHSETITQSDDRVVSPKCWWATE